MDDQIREVVAIVGDVVHGPEAATASRAEAIRDYVATYDMTRIYPRPEIVELDPVTRGAFAGALRDFEKNGSVVLIRDDAVIKRLGRMTRIHHLVTVPREGAAFASMIAIDLLQRYPLLVTAYPPGGEPAPVKPLPKRK